MPTFVLQPGHYQALSYASSGGRARVVVNTSVPVQVYVVNRQNLERFKAKQQIQAFGSDIAYPDAPVDAMVVLPPINWFLVVYNDTNELAAVHCDVFT